MTEKRKQLLRKLMVYVTDVPFDVFEGEDNYEELWDEFSLLQEEVKEKPPLRVVDHNVMLFRCEDGIEINFRCKCGGNVFTKYDDGTYRCNSCNTKYELVGDVDE